MSRHYRQLHSADVPAELDRFVLRQAEEALEQRPAKSRTWMRWSGPLAIAASAVLVLSIVIETGVQKEAMVTTPASAPVMQEKRIERAEHDAAANVASEELLADEAEQKSAGAAADKASTAADKEVHYELPRERRASPPPPAGIRPTTTPPVPLPEAPPARIEGVPMRIESAPPAPKLEMPAPAIAQHTERQVEAPQAVAQSLPPPPAAPAEPPTVTVTARSMAEIAERSSVDAAVSLPVEEAVVTANKRRDQNRLAGPRNSVTPASASGYTRDTSSEEPEQREYSDPEAWLKDIRELRKENKQEAADREWRRFRAAFPNHVVADTDIAREVKK